jgi:hypothetical protein
MIIGVTYSTVQLREEVFAMKDRAHNVIMLGSRA